jgi:hypothetical protein
MKMEAILKITHEKIFDAFPMFSPDGKKIIFCSNRNNGVRMIPIFSGRMGRLIASVANHVVDLSFK